MKKTFCITILLCFAFILGSCTDYEKNIEIREPENIATGDQIYPAKKLDSVEKSSNVNGMRFNLTLYEFTENYNKMKRILGETDLVIEGNWRKSGNITKDTSGTQLQNYYYDDYNVNFTAVVEVESGKLVNIGCGTTQSNFMAQQDDENNSDRVLRKAAMMAVAACQFPENSVSVLQDIFYRITVENYDYMWYEGFIFSLSTRNDKTDSKKSTMLFRVFPVTDELKEEWKATEYKTADN